MSAKRPRPIRRATHAELAERRAALTRIADEQKPTTVRAINYRAKAVVVGITPDQRGYRKVQEDVLKLRRDRVIPWDWIIDLTREVWQVQTWTGVVDALRWLASNYRFDGWSEVDEPVEVWCEADSTKALITPVADKWGVALVSLRGNPSDTALQERAEAWRRDGRVPRVIYLGDLNPKGLHIEAEGRERLEAFLDESVPWERLAVTWEQVEDMDLDGVAVADLDPRDKKQAAQLKLVRDHSYRYPLLVEAEAIAPVTLRAMLDDAIAALAPMGLYEAIVDREDADRQLFDRLADALESATAGEDES